MKRYQVQVKIISGANKGAVVTAELFAKDKDGAQYRTHTLLADNNEYNIVGVKELKE